MLLSNSFQEEHRFQSFTPSEVQEISRAHGDVQQVIVLFNIGRYVQQVIVLFNIGSVQQVIVLFNIGR